MLKKDQIEENQPAIACNLAAIAPDRRERHGAVTEQLFRAVQETLELPDGYAFRLPPETDILLKAAEFISNERLCCSFFRFTLDIEPQRGPLWLKLRGDERVKSFIQAEILPWGLSLNPGSAFQATKQKADKTPKSAAQPPVIACDLNAVPAERRERWLEVGRQVYTAVQEIQELPDGYALRLPGEPEMLLLVAEDLSMERLCCSFVYYTLEIEANGGPLWLRMRGSEEVKEFLRIGIEAINVIDESVASAAGFSLSARTPLDSAEITLETTATLVNQRFAGSNIS